MSMGYGGMAYAMYPPVLPPHMSIVSPPYNMPMGKCPLFLLSRVSLVPDSLGALNRCEFGDLTVFPEALNAFARDPDVCLMLAQ